MRARLKPVATARARVIRADGRREVHYSLERIPLWQLRRRWKRFKHIRFMRKEDETWL